MRSVKSVLRSVLLLEVVAALGLLVAGSCGTDTPTPEEQPSLAEPKEEVAELVKADFNVIPNENFTQKPIKSSYVNAICLNVREAAHSNAKIIGHVFKGDPLEVYEVSGGWYRIGDLAGHVDGWVSSRHISDQFVKSDFIVPEDYKGPTTPTINNSVSAKYVGVKACIPCHNKPHAGFAMGPFGVWRDHFHSSAFETLKTSYSRAFAQKRGIRDPLTDWRCVKCHVTALGVPPERLGPLYGHEEGVGCEVCHGPGGDYLKKHYGPNVNEQELQAMGFRVYSDLKDRENLCRACHNELSPTYKPFNVVAFSAAIRHWGAEYQIEVSDDKPDEIVISEPVPVVEDVIDERVTDVSEEKLYDDTQYFEELVKKEQEPTQVAREPEKRAEPEPPKAPPGDRRLVGVPQDWMLNLQGPRRGAVFFPHKAHLGSYVLAGQEAEVCIVCHHTSTAAATPTNCSDGACHKFQPTAQPSREKAFHGNCRACHRQEGAGPQKCSECHNKA